MRFLFYAVASMSYLKYLLYLRVQVVWRGRDLPSVCASTSNNQTLAEMQTLQYLGPSIMELFSLIVLVLVNSITLFALLILLLRSLWSLSANVTTIEGWEIERHSALLRRARVLGGYLDGPDGIKIRLVKQEFPYDIGIYQNIMQGMGSGLLSWFWPIAASPSNYSSLEFEVNGFEGRKYSNEWVMVLTLFVSQIHQSCGRLQIRTVCREESGHLILRTLSPTAVIRQPTRSKSSLFDRDRSGILLVCRGQALKSSGGNHSMNATVVQGMLTLWIPGPSLMADSPPKVKRAGEIPKEIGYRTLALMRMWISMTKVMYRWRNCFEGDKSMVEEKAKYNRYETMGIGNMLHCGCQCVKCRIDLWCVTRSCPLRLWHYHQRFVTTQMVLSGTGSHMT